MSNMSTRKDGKAGIERRIDFGGVRMRRDGLHDNDGAGVGAPDVYDTVDDIGNSADDA